MASLALRIALVAIATAAGVACPWDDPDLKAWSDPASWPTGSVPGVNTSVVIPSGLKILLDTQPPRLESLTISSGGALVWGDTDGITLETKSILVEGEMHVGSEDCRFTRQGGIFLYGKSDDPHKSDLFGRKFIGVNAGGQLEIHGQDRLSWSKLTATAGPAQPGCGLIFDSRDHLFSTERGEGVHVTLWRPDGVLVEHNLFLTEHATAAADNMERMLAYVQELPPGLVLGLAVFRDLGKVADASLPWEKVYQALQLLGAQEADYIREFEPYALVTVTGDTETTDEARWTSITTGTKEVEAKLAIASSNLTFVARSTVTPSSSPNEARFRVVQSDWESPKITLMHDVSSWQPGDQVVVASTDYDWRQAEVKTIVECKDCSDYQIKLEGEFHYSHFGEVTYGIDERAEVGLLTRNFKVEASLEDQCYSNSDLETELCERFGRDTFGGHIKILLNGTAHLEGFETLHLGQQSVLGSYPLHFHMCDDVTGMYFKQVVVRDSLSRCVTVHTSDGVLISNVVCYLHLGHGMYLEDSAEQNNHFHRNLVIGTMAGTLTPGDRPKDWCPYTNTEACNMLSSFWISHPNNKVTENVAAGSDTHGVAFSFSDVPMGKGYQRYVERGILQPFSTRYTKVQAFDNNIMHSNAKSGLWFDDRLSVGEEVKGEFIHAGGRADISRYSARDPPNEEGQRVDTVFTGLTFYKNGRFDSWVRCGNIIISNSSFGDSREGYVAPHVDDPSHCTVENSIFVGETDNRGEPYLFTRSDGSWADVASSERPSHYFTRSAFDEDPEFTISGVSVYQGPIFVDNCYFDKYYNYFFNDSFTDGSGHRNVRPGAAISFGRTNHYPSTPTSGARNIKYGFCDGENNGHYVFHGNSTTRQWEISDGAINANFRDYDGSITGTPNTHIVHHRPFFTGPECQYRSEWAMSVCPYNYFWLVVRGEDGVLDSSLVKQWPVFMNRDDAPSDVINLEGRLGSKYILRTNMSYTVRWNTTLGDTPYSVRFRAFYGLQQYDVIRLAVCFPKTTTQFTVKSQNPKFDGLTNDQFVSSLAELDADTTGTAFYWDSDTGYFYLKLSSDKTLQAIDQLCAEDECHDVTVTRLDGGAGPVTCDDVVTPFVADQIFPSVPSPPACSGPDSAEGLGAPVVAAPAGAGEATLTCAVVATNNLPDAENQERRGCFDDSGIEEAYIRLYASMTPQLCATRCFHRGYQYAGLRSGSICECGHVFYTSKPLSEQSCGSACSGDSTLTCGGSGVTEVYTTGLAAPTQPARCGPDNRGVAFGGQCLYLSPMREEYMYAQASCLRLGGSLTKIDSVEKQTAINVYLGSVTNHVWAGAAWLGGQWVYLDRSPLQGFSNWRNGADSVSSTRFLRLRADKNFEWDNYGYWDRNMVLCDLPLSWSTVPGVERCGLDQVGMRVTSGDPCLVGLSTEVSLVQAEFNCYLAGGVLAPADADGDKAALERFLYLYGNRVKFWVDGEASNSGYTLGYENRYYPEVQEFPVNTRVGAICLLDEVETIQPCPTGWTVGPSNNCYLHRNIVSRSFEELSGWCNSERSHVLRVESQAENDFIASMLPESKVWLDLRYTPAADDFLQSDGSPASWALWSKNPKLNLDDGSCVTMETASGKWRNKKCYSGGHLVVCEMPAVSVV